MGGYTIKIVAKDNKGDQTQTATTTQELLDDGIKVFVVTTGDTSVAGGQLAVQGGGIASVGGNTAPEVVKSLGKRGFMIVFGDNVQASAAAQYSCQQNYSKAHVIGSPEIPYTKFIPRYYEDAFAHACEARSRARTRTRSAPTDFGSQVTKIQNAEPEARRHLHLDVRAGLRRVHEAAALGGREDAGRHGRRQRQLAARRLRGLGRRRRRVHDLRVPGQEQPRRAVPQAYKKQTGKNVESNTLEAIGRDNVYVIARAAALAKSTDPDKILAAVYKFKHYKLRRRAPSRWIPVGRVPTKEVFLVKMKGKKFTFLTASRRSTSPRPETPDDERGHPLRRRPRRPLRPHRGRAERVVERPAGRDRRPARRQRRGQVEPAQRRRRPRPAAAGRIRVRGRADRSDSPPEAIVRRGISLTPEGRRVFPRLTVADNLRLGGAVTRDRADYDAADRARAGALPHPRASGSARRRARSRAASSRCSRSAGR